MTPRRLPVFDGGVNFSFLESELEKWKGFVDIGSCMLLETFDINSSEDILLHIVVASLFGGIQEKRENFLLFLVVIEVKKVSYLVIVNFKVGYLQLTIL